MILADGLQNSHSLISLDVSYNSFDEDTFNYMMSHLSNNKSLKYLKMDTCNIIDKYIVKAEPYLKGNKSI